MGLVRLAELIQITDRIDSNLPLILVAHFRGAHVENLSLVSRWCRDFTRLCRWRSGLTRAFVTHRCICDVTREHRPFQNASNDQRVA